MRAIPHSRTSHHMLLLSEHTPIGGNRAGQICNLNQLNSLYMRGQINRFSVQSRNSWTYGHLKQDVEQPKRAIPQLNQNLYECLQRWIFSHTKVTRPSASLAPNRWNSARLIGLWHSRYRNSWLNRKVAPLLRHRTRFLVQLIISANNGSVNF